MTSKCCVGWAGSEIISPVAIEEVNTEAIDKAMMEMRRHRRVFIAKHAYGMCGVGKFMKRWKQRQDTTCPQW